jgi:hypothetical protein
MEMMEGDSVVWVTLPSGVGWATIEEGGSFCGFLIYTVWFRLGHPPKRGGNEQKRKKQHAAAFTNEAKEERKRE